MNDQPTPENTPDETLEREVPKKYPLALIFGGVILGIAAGTALAIALRPPTRRATLARTVRDSGERFADFLGTTATQVREPIERTYARAAEAAADVRSRAEKAIGRLSAKKSRCCFWS